MPDYIGPGVTKLRKSSRGDVVTLLVGISSDRDEFVTQLEEAGATVNAKIGQAALRVTASQSDIDCLSELEGLKSLEIEQEDVRRLDEGYESSRQRVTRS